MNQTLLDNNLLCLDRFFPSLAHHAYRKLDLLSGQPVLRVYPSRSGAVTALYQVNGKEYRMASEVDPVRSAHEYVAQMNRAADVFLSIGYALGYVVNELRAVLPLEKTIILIEPSWELFLWQLASLDMTAFLSDPRCVLIVEEHAQHALMTSMITCAIRSLYVMRGDASPMYASVFPGYVRTILDGLTGLIQAYRNDRLSFETETTRMCNEQLQGARTIEKSSEFMKNLAEKSEHTVTEMCYLFTYDLYRHRAYHEETVKEEKGR